MTKDEARHVAAILNAWADGETIQIGEFRGDNENLNVWKDAGITFRSLMTCPYMYRIKPKPREWWAYVGPQNNIQGTFSRKPAPCTGIETIKIGEII